MRILITVPQQDRATGNWTTAIRFRSSLETLGHKVLLCETTLDSAAQLNRAIVDFEPETALLLHGYRSGVSWLNAKEAQQIPYLVLLTGTDMEPGFDDPEQEPVLRQVIEQAEAVLVQNQRLTDMFAGRHPEWSGKLSYLPPGIILGKAEYDLQERHKIPNGGLLFLCPASIRPVKGVLELLQMFSTSEVRPEGFHLAFCGPVLDQGYANSLFQELGHFTWASYLGVVPRDAMPHVFKQSDVILNNSISEGQPNALIEAAVLGRPILAANIPGNADVVKDGINGFLYRDLDEFREKTTRLFTEPGLLSRLSCPLPDRYRPEEEATVLDQLFRNSTGP